MVRVVAHTINLLIWNLVVQFNKDAYTNTKIVLKPTVYNAAAAANNNDNTILLKHFIFAVSRIKSIYYLVYWLLLEFAFKKVKNIYNAIAVANLYT